MEIKIWWTLVEVLAKKQTRSLRSLVCFFSQTSTRVYQILIPTHNHEVTPYSLNLYITRSDIWPQVKRAIGLMVADGHFNLPTCQVCVGMYGLTYSVCDPQGKYDSKNGRYSPVRSPVSMNAISTVNIGADDFTVSVNDTAMYSNASKPRNTVTNLKHIRSKITHMHLYMYIVVGHSLKNEHTK